MVHNIRTNWPDKDVYKVIDEYSYGVVKNIRELPKDELIKQQPNSRRFW